MGPRPTDVPWGQSIALTIDGDRMFVDCGPMTVERLLENGYKLGEFETVFLTHQHLDHDASFFHFATSSWMYGRGRSTVYGPAGTGNLVKALERVYAEDWAYRERFGRDIDAAVDIEFVRTDDSFALERETWAASTLPVDHSIETCAYRFEDRIADETFVYAADTSKLDELVSFAADVGSLVVTHHLPARDLAASRESAAAIFSGELHLAEDGFDVPI